MSFLDQVHAEATIAANALPRYHRVRRSGMWAAVRGLFHRKPKLIAVEVYVDEAGNVWGQDEHGFLYDATIETFYVEA